MSQLLSFSMSPFVGLYGKAIGTGMAIGYAVFRFAIKPTAPHQRQPAYSHDGYAAPLISLA
ncbi:hypothetical protein AC629_09275 [Bradyrhizobium sp. NAS80.1]|nr:hypothetical protein AC629_09275 [Bradyrhizobium sp. NAS80.1]